MTTSITPLSIEQVDPALRGMLQPTVDRLGYFGEFFQYGGHAPVALTGFMTYSGALKGSLPDDLNETLALTICTRLNFAYERIQHERLSLKLGFDRAWIAALTGRSEVVELTRAQASARALAEAILGDRLDEARLTLSDLAGLTSEAIAVAALFQITRYRDVCTIGRIFAMELPVFSIFDENVPKHGA